MQKLVRNGEHFDKSVYKEMHTALSDARNNNVAIIPVHDEIAMQRMIQQFLDVSEFHGNTVCRVSLLFDRVHVWMGDSDSAK